jgi:hypothetical protein
MEVQRGEVKEMKRIIKSELQTKYPELAPLLAKYIEEFPEYDLHCLLHGVLVGDSVMWASSTSFAIGAPLNYHNNDYTFMIDTAAGDMQELLLSIPAIEKEISAWGFSEVEICGKLGWAKMMKPYGFTASRVILKKTIGDNNGR